ncbi:alpha/beta hydrolase family protein [Nibricoccus sp. IMCC34717]|uniref:alpha/beta hydrolase family protein n=1 Tax=Nibricoccus sp. IMCC34717 TaxID=3034021 RepID=UPI00384C1984
MNTAKLLACVLAALCGTAAVAKENDLLRTVPVAADQQIPIADFFRQPLLRDPHVNPAGTHIAAHVQVDEDKTGLLVYEIATQKIEMVGGDGSKDIYWSTWLDDSHLMFTVATRKMYGLGYLCGRVGRLSESYPILQNSDGVLLGVPDADRMKPIFWLRHDPQDNGAANDAGVVALKASYVGERGFINLVSAASDYSDFSRVLENNRLHVESLYESPKGGMPVGFMLDREFNPGFAFTSDQSGVVTMHKWKDKGWIKTGIDLDQIAVLTHADNPGEVIALSPRTEGKPRSVGVMDGMTGEFKQELLVDKAYDFSGWFFRDPISHQIVGAVYERDGPAVVWFEEGYKAMQKALDGMFPGLVVRIIGADRATKTLVVETYSDRQPPIYYFVDLQKRSVGLLKNSMPWIDAKRMRQINILRFKTRDGKSLDAYLTLPAGASKTAPVPLVVLPHGGPFARDSWEFNAEAQFLASRGFAVLQPNYRGSTGYSWQFTLAEEWDFAKMHDDVTDAVRTVLKTGLIDSKRLAIAGGSFGGYLALSGVTREPDLYRCAVTQVGVFDWAQMISDSKYNQFDSPRYAALMRYLGDPKKAADKFTQISPINFVNQIKVPVFVAHGKDDMNVSVAQSKRLISQLQKHNVSYEKFLVGDEGHGMANLNNRVELYTRIEAFLRKNLGMPEAAPASQGAKSP